MALLWPQKYLKPAIYHSGYYFIFISFAIWSIYYFRFVWNNARIFFRTHYHAIILSFVLVALIFTLTPPKFKVLADETNLLGTSMAMFMNKKASVPVQCLAFDPSINNYVSDIDKRPLLYPLIVSLIHSLIGYDPSNAFVLNFILSIMTLMTLYALVTKLADKFWGTLSIFFMASHPNFMMWSTSGGFETLNLFFALQVFLIIYIILSQPKLNPQEVFNAELMIFSFLLLVQCRYESVIFLICAVLLIPLLFKIELMRKYNPIISIVPILLVPFIWQRRLSFYDAAERLGYVIDKPENAFSLKHVSLNLPKNIFVLSGLDPNFGFILTISLLSIIGSYLLVKKFLFEKWEINNKKLFLYSGISFCSLFSLYLIFYFGNFTSPTSNRFTMIFLPYIIISSIYCLKNIIGDLTPKKKIILMSLSIFQFVFYCPVAAHQHLINSLSLTYEYDRTVNYLKQNYDTGKEKILVISDLPNLYIVQNIGSIGFKFAKEHMDKIKTYYNTYYDHIVVLQRIDVGSGLIKENNKLSAQYELEPLGELKINPKMRLKISEVRKIY